MNALKTKHPQTSFWMDSMTDEDIAYALANGMEGITTSPTITPKAMQAEPEIWKDIIKREMEQDPTASEQEITWKAMYKRAGQQAEKIKSIEEKDKVKGRFCIQANVFDSNNAKHILAQAKEIEKVADNSMMKIPTTQGGLKAMEEITAAGQPVMATACSTVGQVLMAGKALTEGMKKARNNGHTRRGPVAAVALQLGLPESTYEGYGLSEEAMELSQTYVALKACTLLKERYPEVRFVLSNFKKPVHWQAFFGKDVILTMPKATFEQARETEAEEIEIKEEIVNELLEKVPHFQKAWDVNALNKEEIIHYPGYRQTIRHFMNKYEDAIHFTRDVMFPKTNEAESTY